MMPSRSPRTAATAGPSAADGGRAAPAVSVVAPCRDEAGNLPELVDQIGTALAGRTFEVIVVDDGSSDDTATVLAALHGQKPWLRHVRHERPTGQSAAIRSGILAARGDVIVTIDGDGQNDPAYIPALLDALDKGGNEVALAAGQRTGRVASLVKRLASRFANKLRSAVLKDDTRDTGCGLKALPREVFLRLPYFDGWHRYLPALVQSEGYCVTHVDVVDRARRHGRSKYGILDRALIGVADLIGVWWLLRRRRHAPKMTETDFDAR